MKHMSFKALAVAATLLISHGASAATLTIDSGWNRFAFGAVGTMAYKAFTFTLTGGGLLSLADGFKAGDQFEVFINNVSFGKTSLPTPTTTSIGQNYTAALTNSNYSSWVRHFTPGTYTVSMLVTKRSGTDRADHLAGIRLDTAPVPLPAAGMMLLSALGAAAALRRRRT